jgi:hypothetical protein
MIATEDRNRASEAALAETDVAHKSLQVLERAVLKTDAELQWMVQVTATIKDSVAEVETKRDSFTAKFREAKVLIDAGIRDFNCLFEPALTSLASCERVAKAKIVSFAESRAVQRREIIAQAGEAVEEGRQDIAAQLIASAETLEIPKIAGLALKRSTSFMVVDRREAVAWCVQHGRLDLLTVDEPTCKALVKAGSLPQIDGVRHGESFSVAVTKDKVQR